MAFYAMPYSAPSDCCKSAMCFGVKYEYRQMFVRGRGLD